MKLMILAGGYGSRIADINDNIPKPMILLDDKPIIEHIIKIYKFYKIKKFIILSGHMHNKINEFFKKKYKSFSDCEIKIFNTGLNTLTGSRILLAKNLSLKKTF